VRRGEGWGNSTGQNDQSDIDKYIDYALLLEAQGVIGGEPIKCIRIKAYEEEIHGKQ
jgi:hypothetical protein